MKLYHLKFGGLGPFKSTFDIDFDQLGKSGLFLIEGPTGSGKSTLIDAIVFALYGHVAGEDSGKGRLVSQFLDPADGAPFAELTFETADGIYRVTRQPEFERVKKRGDGVTRSPAKASLFSLTPGEIHQPTDDIRSVPLASAPAAVNSHIPRLLGLDRSQFTQTIVLPQGEFTTFLRAKADDRRKLLEKLFDTGRYSRIADEFDARRKVAESAFQTVVESVRARSTMFAEAAGLDDDQTAEVVGAVVQPDSLSALFASHETRLRAEAEAARLVREAAVTARKAAEAGLQQATDRRHKVVQRQSVDARQAEFDRQIPAVQLAESQLQALDRSALPLGLHGQWQEAVTQYQMALERRGQALQQHEELDALQVDELNSQSRACRDEAAKLAALVTAEADFAARKRKVDELATQATQAATKLNELNQMLVARRAVRDQHDTEIREQAQLAAEATGLRSAHQSLSRQLTAAISAEQLAASLEPDGDVSQRLHDATQADRQREDDYLSLSQAYRAEVAAVLADELIDDEPCPVCGSREHPAKAVPALSGASRADVDAAAKRASRARQALDAARAAFDATDAERRALEVVAGGSRSQLQAQFDALGPRLAAAEAADTRVTELETLRSDDVSALAELETRRTAEGRAASDLDAALAVQQSQLDELVDSLAAARGDFESVQARVNFLRSSERILDDVARATTQRDLALAKRDECRRALDEALADVGLNDDEQFAQLLALASRRNELREQVSAHAGEGVILLELQRDLVDVDPAEIVDLTAPTLALESALTSEATAASHAQSTADSLRRAQVRAREAHAEISRLAILRAESAELISLAGVINGSGALNVSLPLFAVTRRFTEVVDVANQRLTVMLGGRLSLEAHDDQTDRRTKFGLGLRVIDRDSGFSRDTSTLSGGEGFCCALALALALAEVVAAENGAVRTEALFIDEGFGSLDPATLDDVTIELNRLRGEGRMVGVVSHVTEMKAQIHSQIRVRRVESGFSELSVAIP